MYFDHYLEDEEFLNQYRRILIVGGSGTGKSYLLRKIFEHNPDNNMLFINLYGPVQSYLSSKTAGKNCDKILLDSDDVPDAKDVVKTISLLQQRCNCLIVSIPLLINQKPNFSLLANFDLVVELSRHKLDEEDKGYVLKDRCGNLSGKHIMIYDNIITRKIRILKKLLE